MKKFKNVALRIAAVFVLGALGTIGAGAVFGIKPLLAASIAGLLAVFEVIQELARYFIADGSITDSEINEAFSRVSSAQAETSEVPPVVPPTQG